MKTSLRRLRGVLHKHESKDRRDLRFLVQKDELAQASQVPIFISLQFEFEIVYVSSLN